MNDKSKFDLAKFESLQENENGMLINGFSTSFDQNIMGGQKKEGGTNYLFCTSNNCSGGNCISGCGTGS